MSRQKCFVTTCDRQTTAGLCHTHRAELEKMLDGIPDTFDQLRIQTTRQSRYSTNTASRSQDPALMFNDISADLDRELRRTITTWQARTADHLGTPVRYPNAIASAMWIRTQLHNGRLNTWPGIGIMHETLTADLTTIERVIDKPGERWYAGVCSSPTDNGPCEAELYSQIDTGTIQCPRCGAAHSISDRRAILLNDADDTLVTATEAALAITVWSNYGRTQTSLRDRITTWDKRGRIQSRGTITVHGKDRKLYRVGDIRALLQTSTKP